ncbi:MAG: class I SAM-dependent methyltransferase [Lachnospiraceae bacterium]|nr:class I SAM-dependent methyltransferase [Lachnospiraceae bacterium]
MENILNLKYYCGQDNYSDGEVEDELLDIVKNNDDYDEVLCGNNDWAFLYHLSPIRENLLEWYDFNGGGSLLEIGSGCGALTGLFCRKLSRVVGIDLSKKRSTINAYKNKRYNNLEIYVGNFADIAVEEKFDYVTLIGVLEYSCYYVGGKDAFKDMLVKAGSYLKPGGTLIVAIENKYGLKYWAGAKEDHTGVIFDGILGYEGVDRVRTFSRKGLEDLLVRSGFNDNQFYYPVPDYKMPNEIFTPGRLPGKGDLRGMSRAYDRDRHMFFDEELAYDSICGDGMFEIFANSFLVFSKKSL